jgi:hypothetical protein
MYPHINFLVAAPRPHFISGSTTEGKMEQKENIRLELIVHAYNTSYSGGGKD